MHRSTIILIALVIGHAASAQPPAIEWQKALGGSDYDSGWALEQTSDGGYVIAGSTSSTNGNVTGQHGLNDMWVVKLAADGSLQWQKALGGSDDDYGYAIQQTSDQGYVVAGSSYSSDGDVSSNQGANDLWVVKLDATGTIQWEQTYGGSGQDYAKAILQTADGGYIVAGATTSNDGDVIGNHGYTDMWVIRLDTGGALLWQRALGSSGGEFANAIADAGDGGHVIAGAAGGNDGDVTGFQGGLYDYWIVKLDGSGLLQWQKSCGGSGNDVARDLARTSDGGPVAAGISNSNDGDITSPHGAYDYWVVKLDASGSLQWQTAFGGSANDYGQSITATAGNDIVIAGGSESSDGDVTTNLGGSDVWLVRSSDSGSLVWEKSMGGSGIEGAEDITLTTDGGYAFCGGTASNDGDVSGNHGSSDMWVVKLAPDHTAVAEAGTAMVTFDLFPVPTRGDVHISFGLGGPAILRIDIHDQAGALIHTEQGMSTTIGSSFTINTANLASGQYLLRVITDKGAATRAFLKL